MFEQNPLKSKDFMAQNVSFWLHLKHTVHDLSVHKHDI